MKTKQEISLLGLHHLHLLVRRLDLYLKVKLEVNQMVIKNNILRDYERVVS